MRCVHCRKKINLNATICPYCLKETHHKRIKKVLLVLALVVLAITMLFGIVGGYWITGFIVGMVVILIFSLIPAKK